MVVHCQMGKNRLQSVLHRHNLAAPGIDPFGAKHRPWWEALTLSPCERLRMQQDWAVIATLGSLIETVERELAQLRKPRSLERTRAFPYPTARHWVGGRDDHPGSDWRYHALPHGQTSGRLRWLGYADPRLGPGTS